MSGGKPPRAPFCRIPPSSPHSDKFLQDRVTAVLRLYRNLGTRGNLTFEEILRAPIYMGGLTRLSMN